MVKNLIIKSTYSLLPDGRIKSNLGDLLRTTVLLECLQDRYLWLTDEKGKQLLHWFLGGEKVITFPEAGTDSRIPSGAEIYNLDNFVFSQEVFRRLQGNWHGFLWDGKGRVRAQNEIIALTEPYRGVKQAISFQQAVVEGLGFCWKEQDYKTCRLSQKIRVDVGLNWHVLPEWKSKAWPQENWQRLAEKLGKTYAVSWQKGLGDIEDYIHWLAACELIVTPDTLGLHLASALRKNVVTLLGPTESKEFSYGRVVSLRPGPRSCMPCHLPACQIKEGCLQEIAVGVVVETVREILSRPKEQAKFTRPLGFESLCR